MLQAPAVARAPHQIPGIRDVTTETDRFNKLRHDLSNPLSALLAETQLLLLNESKLDPETLTSLREIEALAVRMRGIMREC
jgi:signal transduction histidine kinase